MDRITPVIDFEAELGGLFEVKDKVAYLPGGYGGLGEVIAWGLALAGAKVVVAGRSEEKAEALAEAMREKGLEAAGLAMDATSVEETASGYRLRLSSDAGSCASALELIYLERRCWPFLDLALQFDAGDEAAVLSISGGEGVKEFLRQNSVLGCAQLGPGSALLARSIIFGRLHA